MHRIAAITETIRLINVRTYTVTAPMCAYTCRQDRAYVCIYASA